MGPAVQIMGILNVTPDSFSDGGRWTQDRGLEERVEQLLAEGADLIDVGGESTRPGAAPVPADEELRRVIPALRAIRLRSEIPISIDTYKAEVARAALGAGATIINDIWSLRQDPAMIEVLRASTAQMVLTHMRGAPADMQHNPCYQDVVAEINAFFAERITWLLARGVERERIILDPGIGFGKSLQHNLTILRGIPAFKAHGCQVLIGHSRKTFLGELLDIPVDRRDWPTALVSSFCARQGADIVRVHDVQATRMALRLDAALHETAA